MQSARCLLFCVKHQGCFGNLAVSAVAGSSGGTIRIARPVTRPTISASISYLNCRIAQPDDGCETSSSWFHIHHRVARFGNSNTKSKLRSWGVLPALQCGLCLPMSPQLPRLQDCQSSPDV